jgi:hypothetical protein
MPKPAALKKTRGTICIRRVGRGLAIIITEDTEHTHVFINNNRGH